VPVDPITPRSIAPNSAKGDFGLLIKTEEHYQPQSLSIVMRPSSFHGYFALDLQQ
jgi:hypothetical protein